MVPASIGYLLYFAMVLGSSKLLNLIIVYIIHINNGSFFFRYVQLVVPVIKIMQVESGGKSNYKFRDRLI